MWVSFFCFGTNFNPEFPTKECGKVQHFGKFCNKDRTTKALKYTTINIGGRKNESIIVNGVKNVNRIVRARKWPILESLKTLSLEQEERE